MCITDKPVGFGILIAAVIATTQCDQKKSPNVYKSCPKMISAEILKIFT